MRRSAWCGVGKSLQQGKNMSTISAEQRFALFTALGAKTKWNELTTEQVQAGISGTDEELVCAGNEFTLFIRNGFRMQMVDLFRDTGELTIQIPALPRPTLVELRAKHSWVKAEGGIERDFSPVEPVTLKLGSVLLPNEERIDGSQYEVRLTPKLNLLLGYQHAVWLVENQDKFPELMKLLGEVYIDFPGLVVVNEDGDRSVFYLTRGGGHWRLSWHDLAYGVDADARVAFSGK